MSTTAAGKTASLPVIDISPFLSEPAASGQQQRDAVTRALADACRDYGFFYLTGHGVEPATTAAVLGAARAFFTESKPAAKAAIRRQNPGQGMGDGARGYQVLAENVTKGKRDWHEALDWYREIRPGEGVQAADLVEVDVKDEIEDEVKGDEGVAGEGPKNGGTEDTSRINSSSSSSPSPSRLVVTLKADQTAVSRDPPYALLQGVNPWPSHPPEFRQLYETYVVEMRRVGIAVLRALGQALELQDPDTFARATEDSFWVMRAIGYPPLDPELAAQGGVSCGEHTDYGCLTLLLADDTRGALQVLHRRRHRRRKGSSTDDVNEGVREEEDDDDDDEEFEEEWINADPVEGAYVVNVGDMIETWTNGLVRSTRHRVVHRGAAYRVSVPFFLEPGLDTVVAPLPECVARTQTRTQTRTRTRTRTRTQQPIPDTTQTGQEENASNITKNYTTTAAAAAAAAATPSYPAVRYGDHLAAKVGGNFYGGGG